MWSPGYGARRWAADASCRAAAGPAMTTLRSVAARIARTVRCVAIAYIVVQVVIWHSFYAADPWRLAGPAAAVAWATAMVAANKAVNEPMTAMAITRPISGMITMLSERIPTK